MRKNVGKLFQLIFIQISQADWLKVVIISAFFEKRKDEVLISERASLSVFATLEFTRKEGFDTQKQVLQVHLRLWPAQKRKILTIFYEG